MVDILAQTHTPSTCTFVFLFARWWWRHLNISDSLIVSRNYVYPDLVASNARWELHYFVQGTGLFHFRITIPEVYSFCKLNDEFQVDRWSWIGIAPCIAAFGPSAIFLGVRGQPAAAFSCWHSHSLDGLFLHRVGAYFHIYQVLARSLCGLWKLKADSCKIFDGASSFWIWKMCSFPFKLREFGVYQQGPKYLKSE